MLLMRLSPDGPVIEDLLNLREQIRFLIVVM